MAHFAFKSGLEIGEGFPIRVNCNIGCNSLNSFNDEVEKIQYLKTKG